MLAPDARAARAAGGGLAMKGIDAPPEARAAETGWGVARKSNQKGHEPVKEMR
jgi:hypothetical protein